MQRQQAARQHDQRQRELRLQRQRHRHQTQRGTARHLHETDQRGRDAGLIGIRLQRVAGGRTHHERQPGAGAGDRQHIRQPVCLRHRRQQQDAQQQTQTAQPHQNAAGRQANRAANLVDDAVGEEADQHDPETVGAEHQRELQRGQAGGTHQHVRCQGNVSQRHAHRPGVHHRKGEEAAFAEDARILAYRQPFDRHGVGGAGFRQAQRDEHQHQQRIADQEPERGTPAEGFGEQAAE